MRLTSKLLRRAFGLLCLIVALVMLIVGETNPSPEFNQMAFVGYWLGCFAFALLALGVALLDLRTVRHEARVRQRSLLEEALHEIEAEKRRRPAGSGRKGATDLSDDLRD